jgi:hypothetical protein
LPCQHLAHDWGSIGQQRGADVWLIAENWASLKWVINLYIYMTVVDYADERILKHVQKDQHHSN